jgi:hypothetical protein
MDEIIKKGVEDEAGLAIWDCAGGGFRAWGVQEDRQGRSAPQGNEGLAGNGQGIGEFGHGGKD